MGSGQFGGRLRWVRVTIGFLTPLVVAGFEPELLLLAYGLVVAYQTWIHTELIRKRRSVLRDLRPVPRAAHRSQLANTVPSPLAAAGLVARCRCLLVIAPKRCDLDDMEDWGRADRLCGS